MGDLALSGVDPRLWDLNQLLAAYEAMMRRGSKDEAEWSRKRQALYMPPAGTPREVAATAAGGAQTVSSMEAMIARMNAADSALGAV